MWDSRASARSGCGEKKELQLLDFYFVPRYSLTATPSGVFRDSMVRRRVSSSSLATSRGGLILLILAALATTSSLAYASPPDPSWIPGIYDDADFDDVVGLATSETSLAGPEGAIALRLVRPPTSPEAPRLESAISRFPTAALHVRAPPTV
jgi:hypothetical protein